LTLYISETVLDRDIVY